LSQISIPKIAIREVQWEITYKCNLDCLHCYIPKKDRNKPGAELTTREVIKVLEKLKKAGVIYLIFTGGEPLIRKDFPQIYLEAKKKGFLISVFTNGTLIDKELADLFGKYRPFSIEITLHSIKENIFEQITQRKGSFEKTMKSIELLYERKVPMVLKTVGLKINKEDILSTKNFIRNFKGVHYKFDSLIIPSLDRNPEPLSYRLTPTEIVKIENSDDEFKEQIRRILRTNTSLPEKYRNSLYPCYERTQGSTIDPQGKLSYCLVERSFGIDVLSENDIWESYLEKARQLQKKVFPPNSPCANCKIRMLCPQCPGRSYLLGVNPYQPVDYYCELAKERFKSRELYLR